MILFFCHVIEALKAETKLFQKNKIKWLTLTLARTYYEEYIYIINLNRPSIIRVM